MISALEGNSVANPPATDQFELSIFGPGVGECLVLHFGNSEWVVIDSCRYPTSKDPIAINYLEQIGVDPTNAIRCILATHWHDDHIHGLSDLVRRCPGAIFAMSAALSESQFYQLVLKAEEQNKYVAASSSASEFADILEQIISRSIQPPYKASDGFLLYQGGFNGQVQMKALSPSPATVQNSMVGIAQKLAPNINTHKLRCLSPNDLSVAVQVSTGKRDLLLKADLENSKDPLNGWEAVLASHLRPRTTSSIVKVGHHGSENADNHDVWTTMVDTGSTSVVTPFVKLRSPLPSDNDVRRLKSHNTNLYCTTWPPRSRPPRRPVVDGLVKSATRNWHALNRHPGFVRIRFSLTSHNQQPTIESFGTAEKV